jgi:hypothetical protein
LPALIVNAAVWVVDPRPRVRQTGCVLWVVSLVAFGWAQLEPSPTEHGYVALGEAFAKRSSHDVLIAPVYLDVPLDVYTRDAESAKLRVVLQEGRLDALLFACLDSDPRASFERYNLSDDYNMRFEVSLPEAQFDEFFRAGDVRMLGLTDGRRVYPHQETEWEMAQGEAGLRLAEPAFGGLPAIGVRNDGEEFVAVEATRFQAVQEGLMAITFAGRGTANVLATLCEDEGGLWRPQIAYRGQLFPPVMTDARGVTWTLETRIVPVQPNKGYSVCITGKGPGERYVGDLLYTYFPFRPE